MDGKVIIIILRVMNDVQIKLNELVSPKEITSKRRGSLYSVNNSLRRNTLYPLSSIKTEEIGYDCKLPQVSLKRKDLCKVLNIILSKQQMNLADRNFLRRILVQIFDEELICSGSRQFINHLKLLDQKAHHIIHLPQQRLFYFILKGKAQVKSGGFTYTVSEGETFGELELLSNQTIEEITYTQRTLMVTLNQANFDNYFRYYFQKKYEERMSNVACIEEKYLQQIPEINRYFFLNQLKSDTFNPGDKIIQMGRPVTRIYFVGHQWKGGMQSNLVDGCFGLKEVMKNKQEYIESAFCLEVGYQVHYVEKDAFVKYVKEFLNMTVSMGRSAIQTKTIIHNPQEKASVKKLMNIKRVKFSSKAKKIRTEPIELIVSDFKFFKNQIQPPIISKMQKNLSNTVNLSNFSINKRKTQSIQLKAYQRPQF